ncbi:conserved hypothetical protein [Mesorhizobium plurifarium]|uniref:Uncharacterized protein n=1 Tax=Mesorhizobium plurifarium TaxID=69974 RepID=A0A090GAJ5_MESPL|nr:conserved hypothetical protein [Mesorhizobium plurifarium]
MNGSTDYTENAPLRLDTAARIAFPDGSMGAAGLRKERDRGRLETEIIAGKEYTTLAAIGRMRELCRVQAKEFDSSGGPKAERPTVACVAKPVGTSRMPDDDIPLAAARANLLKLKSASPNTSTKNTSRRASAIVTPIK